MTVEDVRPDLQQTIGRIRAAVDDLEKCYVPEEKADETARLLRDVNKKIWKVVDQVESRRLEYWHSMGRLVEDIGKLADKLEDASGQPVASGSIWHRLLNEGALALRSKQLLKVARDLGLDPEDYRHDADSVTGTD